MDRGNIAENGPVIHYGPPNAFTIRADMLDVSVEQEGIPPMKTGSIIIAVAALITAALSVVWYSFSPSWTVRQMQVAANAGSTAQLAKFIDFPTLRASLKGEIVTTFGYRILQSEGHLIGTDVDTLVEEEVNARNMQNVFSDKKSKAPWVLDDLDAAGSNTVIDRPSLSTFRLSTPKAPAGIMIFELHGLSWKLSSVDLPAA